MKLLTEIRNCLHCAEHLPLGPRPVVVAHPQARINIIGQAPGRVVHQSGIPWDDQSGKRLRSWLGVDDDTFYNPAFFAIMPMGFCYPGKGKTGDLPPRSECAPLWHQPLLNSMPNVQLTLLIGQYAQKYYLHKQARKNLTETVRHWYDYWPNLLPMPHPSPRNRRWLARNEWFETDVVPVLQRRVQELIQKEAAR